MDNSSYYDLDNNRIFVKGFKDLIDINGETMVIKKLNYKFVTPSIYYITQWGTVISTVTQAMISPSIDSEGFPYVRLSVTFDSGFDIVHTLDDFRIVDLVACNFIRNSESYLERGCIAINKNGIKTYNHYKNIEYKEP